MSALPELRDYQTGAIRSVLAAWKSGHRKVLLVSPTGSGKTRMGMELVSVAVRHGRRVLWLAHRNELLEQAHNVLWEGTGLEPGVSGPGTDTLPNAAVRVATVQTLVAREDAARPEADLVVWDEAHHHVAAEWGRVATHYAHAHGFGLTATPERSDGRPLGDLFETMVVAASYPQLVDAGHIVPARVFAPDGALAKGLANNPVQAYLKHGEGGQCFLFAASVELAYQFAREFREAGISAECIEGTTNSDKRKDLLDRFRAGELRVLTNVYVLTEGVDVPAASVCLIARGVGHVTPYLQMVGRVLRPAPGKEYGIVIDLSGVTYTHGLPTELREYSLTGGIRRLPKSERALRVCQRCGMTFVGVKCSRCGFQLESKKPRPTIYDMTLREVYAGAATPEEAKRRWLNEQLLLTKKSYAQLVHEYVRLFDQKPRDVPEGVRKAEWQRLLERALQEGHKAGWAAHRYKASFGTWPPREWRAA